MFIICFYYFSFSSSRFLFFSPTLDSKVCLVNIEFVFVNIEKNNQRWREREGVKDRENKYDKRKCHAREGGRTTYATVGTGKNLYTETSHVVTCVL